MPQRNVNKTYVNNSYYHIYNRGVNKAPIFLDNQDFTVFLGLLKRYLGEDPERKPNRELHSNYYNDMELLAFCLMPNHFHLLVYQKSATGIKSLMKSLGVSYSMYFNVRYKRTGPLFQQRYKAVMITDDAQLLHITRYIHMNPLNYIDYQWSSLPYYKSEKKASWVRPGRVLELFEGESYLEYLRQYRSRRDELSQLKQQLADC